MFFGVSIVFSCFFLMCFVFSLGAGAVAFI